MANKAIGIAWRCRRYDRGTRKGTILASRYSSALRLPSRSLTRFLFLQSAAPCRSGLEREERTRNQKEVVKSMASSAHSATSAFLNSISNVPPPSPPFSLDPRASGVRTFLHSASTAPALLLSACLRTFRSVLALFHPGNEERERCSARSRKKGGRGKKKH